MSKPRAPSDPASTVTDEPDTGGTQPVLPPVNTDATFVELPPASSQPNLQLSVSEEVGTPLRKQLDLVDISARSTVTTEDPEPEGWREWLASPASRTWRIGASVAGASLAALLLVFLITPKITAPPPMERKVLRIEPPAPKSDVVLAPPRLTLDQAPMFVDVEVDGGDGTLRIQKVPGGLIKVNTSPETEVTVNGRKLGTTPLFVAAPIGRVELILESRDAGIYKPVYVDLASGRNPPRSWELAKGWLEILAPPGSLVSVNGRSVGAAPVEQQSLYEGYYRVEVVRPDKSRVSSRVEVVARFTVTHEISDR